MKICWIVPGFSRDKTHWAIPVLQTLACALAQHHELHVFSLRYPEKGEFQVGEVWHHALGRDRLGIHSLSLWAEGVRRVVAEHRQRPFDLLHAFWADEPGLVAGLAGRLLQKPTLVSLGGGELVYLPHIGYGTQRSAVRRAVIRLALALAEAVTAGSRYQLEQTTAVGVPAAKCHLASLGVDTERFQPKTGSGETSDFSKMPLRHQESDVWCVTKKPVSSPVIIQAASLVPVKNQPLLLQIFAQVQKTIPDSTLILAGEGPLEADLRAQAATLGVSQHIQWRQKVAYEEMTAVYQTAQLYVQTSWHESQGMAVLEAMACGLPVVGTPVGVAREVACLPASWGAEELARQVTAVLQNRVTYPPPRAIVQAQFSLPVALERFLHLYESL